MAPKHLYGYHLLAIFTIFIWGITFVSTKVLIGNGLSPVEIFIYRFLLAYIGIWLVCPHKLFAHNLKDEVLCVVAGMGGGSLYFVFENTALQYTLASNVALIICTAPIFTAFLTRMFYREDRLKPKLILGSLMALAGVAFVVYNGSFVLKLNPLGDFLTILAAISWAFYGIVLRRLSRTYHTLFITRKVFFYGLVTVLPFIFFRNDTFHIDLLSSPTVYLNLAFLGIIASLLCYAFWNTAVKKLGVVQTSNYIYFIPLVTLITSAIVIDEKITLMAIAGSIFIIGGVYVADRR